MDYLKMQKENGKRRARLQEKSADNGNMVMWSRICHKPQVLVEVSAISRKSERNALLSIF
jgi:hypothetical protein